MDKLLKYIRSLTTFSEESWEMLQPALTRQHFKKDEHLLHKGQACKALFYIKKGYCKSYYVIDGERKNTGFFFENEIATNVKSFGSGEPSAWNIVACEPLDVIAFDKEKLLEVTAQSGEIARLGKNCIRRFATKQEELGNILKLYGTQERLEFIETNYPEIVKRVPLSQIASFLGVTRETLSRIRSKRVSN